MQFWLSSSEFHFFAKLEFRTPAAGRTAGAQDSLDLLKPVGRHDALHEIPETTILSCVDCFTTELQQAHLFKAFLKSEKHHSNTLPTLDEFAGSGAFGKAMESVYPSIKVVHAVEINHAAAETIKCVLFHISET